MRLIIRIAALGVTLAIVAGFAGRVHPVGDSFAAFRLHLAGAAVILWAVSALSGLVRAEKLTGLAACLALGSILYSAWLPLPATPAGGVTVLQHNVLWRNERLDQMIAQITAADADIVLLQEPVPNRTERLRELAPYTEHLVCGAGAMSNHLLLSRLPVLASGCVQQAGWMQVQTALGPVTFVSVHLRWPWPYSQPIDLDVLVPLFESLPRPMVVAGDFNSAKWSEAVARIAAASDTIPVSGLRLTFADPRFWPGLPIDHVLMPEGWVGTARMLNAAGSDHRATLATMGPPAQ